MGMDDQTRSHRVGGDYPGSHWGTEEHKNNFALGFCAFLLCAVLAAVWFLL